MIHCRVLGPIEVSVDGGPAPPELLWRKNLALLVYLARSPERSRPREHLIGLLWPDSTQQKARRSLNTALSSMRLCLGEGNLIAQADRVKLAADAVRLDCDDFTALAASGEWHRAAALVAGLFLEGLAIPGASEFERWLTIEQHQWSQRTVEALLRAADLDLKAGRATEAAVLAERARIIDPLSEPAARAAMRALALGGDRAGALKAFEDLRVRLEREVGTSPSADTVALQEIIRRERIQRAAARLTPPAPERRRAPLVGRELELNQLWEVWRGGPAAGTAAVAVVAGDAGVGKSRLVDELVARIRLEGAAPVLVRAVEGDREVPWSGVLGLARGGMVESAGLAAASPASLAWFGERLTEWADRFPATRGLAPAPSPAQALSDILGGALEEQPVALVIDDADRLDHDSLLALGGVMRDHARRPLLLILTVPSAPARAELDELEARIGRDVPGRVVRLAPLSAAAVQRLAAWAVPSYEVTALDRLTRRVYTDSAGLPLLAIEILNAVALGLDLATIHGAWPEPLRTLDQTLPGDLPEGIVSAIRVGFRRLSSDAQRVLQVAAVLPPPLELDRVARVGGLTREAAIDALDELEWNRWLTVDGRGYGFAARIVRDVIARDQLTEGQRQRIAAAGEAS